LKFPFTTVQRKTIFLHRLRKGVRHFQSQLLQQPSVRVKRKLAGKGHGAAATGDREAVPRRLRYPTPGDMPHQRRGNKKERAFSEDEIVGTLKKRVIPVFKEDSLGMPIIQICRTIAEDTTVSLTASQNEVPIFTFFPHKRIPPCKDCLMVNKSGENRFGNLPLYLAINASGQTLNRPALAVPLPLAYTDIEDHRRIANRSGLRLDSATGKAMLFPQFRRRSKSDRLVFPMNILLFFSTGVMLIKKMITTIPENRPIRHTVIPVRFTGIPAAIFHAPR
jgi:hypothetical protein